jgi:ABC-type phosphonate transport system ATPase subunit
MSNLPLIEIHDLSKTYGDKLGVKNVTLAVVGAGS